MQKSNHEMQNITFQSNENWRKSQIILWKISSKM